MSYRATRPFTAAALILIAGLVTTPALSEKKAKSSGIGEGTTEFATPTAEDAAPTLSDEAETLELSPDKKEVDPKAEKAPEAASTVPASEPAGNKCVVEIGEIKSPPTEQEVQTGAEGEEAKAEPVDLQAEGGECVDMTDAKPTMMGPDGKVVEIGADVVTTEDLIRQRLQERRLEIEARATDIDAQQAILEAAEKRIEERMATLEQLQNEIDATVDQSEAAAAEQFKAVVAAYETMKPAAAAAIFNEMPDEVLLGIAKEMNPRKIASILSKMDPARAGALTVQLASAN